MKPNSFQMSEVLSPPYVRGGICLEFLLVSLHLIQAKLRRLLVVQSVVVWPVKDPSDTFPHYYWGLGFNPTKHG